MDKTWNNKAWFMVLPAFVVVAFSAVIPLMTVVNYSVQDTFGNNEFFWAGTDWFNTKTFPSASFVSSAIKPLGENRYEVSGTLTIKGQSQTVTVPAVLSKDGQTGLFEGAFTIQRGQFKIGEGAWSKFDIVANDVTVNFRIAATAH